MLSGDSLTRFLGMAARDARKLLINPEALGLNPWTPDHAVLSRDDGRPVWMWSPLSTTATQEEQTCRLITSPS